MTLAGATSSMTMGTIACAGAPRLVDVISEELLVVLAETPRLAADLARAMRVTTSDRSGVAAQLVGLLAQEERLARARR
jgi:hypothetical protein